MPSDKPVEIFPLIYVAVLGMALARNNENKENKASARI
jgi:hypothetical protein